MGILAGLVAALTWTLASSLWRGLATSLNAIQLNGLKNAIACAALLPVLITLPWAGEVNNLMLLLISGGMGISLGDSFYLAALRRLGTRRTLTLESLSPVAAATGGWHLGGGGGGHPGAGPVTGVVTPSVAADSRNLSTATTKWATFEFGALFP